MSKTARHTDSGKKRGDMGNPTQSERERILEEMDKRDEKRCKTGNLEKKSTWFAGFRVLSLVCFLATAILLIKHKGVDEYFYEQNT